MHTFYLGQEQVAAYLRDLSARLLDSKRHPISPSVLVAIGTSGLELAYKLVTTDDRWIGVSLLRCHCDQGSGKIEFHPDDPVSVAVKNAHVLIIDSAVHTGGTMRKVYAAIEAIGPESVVSYTLVLKQSASIVPNFFGLLMGRHDRAFFLLDRIPNMRVMRNGCLRPMEEQDINAPKIDCEVESINKFGWPELWYDVAADEKRHTYIFEKKGAPRGFISYKINDAQLLIDVVAVDKDWKGGGIGPNLIRWAETCARTANCKNIILWARIDEDLLRLYCGLGYDFVRKKELRFPDEHYALMTKEILHDNSVEDLLRID